MKTVRIIAITCALLWVGMGRAAAQDRLAEAKQLYDSASYNEALSALNRVSGSADVVDLEKYRALCLLALDRPKDAEQSLERLAMTRPLYTLDSSDSSPKLVALFQDVRKRTLPEASKQTYLRARASFEKGDMAAAAQQFKDVIAMADAAPAESAALIGDLKMLSAGFLKLAQTANESQTAAPAAPATNPPASAPVAVARTTPTLASPAAASTSPVAAPPAQATAASRLTPASVAYERIYSASDTYVKAAVAVSRPLPKWERPAALKAWGYQGLLEVVVGEDGSVTEAIVVKSIHPGYDRSLIQTAKSWRFSPASIDGRAVKYRMVYSVVVPAR